MAYSVAPGSSLYFKGKLIKEKTILSKEILESLGDEVKVMERDGFVVYFDESLSAPPEEGSLKFKGKWFHDPVNLQGRTLEQLNLMVKEIDPSVEPFDTSIEAIAQLSADFS